jgi:hypothetical protein
MKKVSHASQIQVRPTPKDSSALQLTYETEDGRSVINIPHKKDQSAEPEPHGAGSFHDPEHHQQLMDRIEAMLKQE